MKELKKNIERLKQMREFIDELIVYFEEKRE